MDLGVGRKRAGPIILVLLALTALVLPLWQMYDWMAVKKDKEQTVVLLYQVTQLQMEMLGSTITDASPVSLSASTSALNEWKRSAYGAQYAHERLAEAVGGGLIPRLEGLEALNQWILRMQVGGARSLDKEELGVAAAAASGYKSLLEAYGGLNNQHGTLSASAAGRLKKADSALAETVRKKLK